jgi:hypothetical protein
MVFVFTCARRDLIARILERLGMRASLRRPQPLNPSPKPDAVRAAMETRCGPAPQRVFGSAGVVFGLLAYAQVEALKKQVAELEQSLGRSGTQGPGDCEDTKN